MKILQEKNLTYFNMQNNLSNKLKKMHKILIKNIIGSEYRKESEQSVVDEKEEIPPRPRIYCDAFDWVGQDMYTLNEFCFLIDKKSRNKNQYFKTRKFKDIQDIEFASEKQQKKAHFNKDIYDQLQFYTDGFSYRQVIHDNLDYRDPHFINTSNLCMMLMHDKKACPHSFILPMFLVSGRFHYIIEYQGEFFFHKAVINFRKE